MLRGCCDPINVDRLPGNIPWATREFVRQTSTSTAYDQGNSMYDPGDIPPNWLRSYAIVFALVQQTMPCEDLRLRRDPTSQLKDREENGETWGTYIMGS